MFSRINFPQNVNRIFNHFLIVAIIITTACGGTGNNKAREQTSGNMPDFPSDAAKNYAFCEAALAGNTALMEKLFSSYNDINEPVCEGRNVLMLASFNGHIDIINMLLKAGAKVDLRDESGRTALMYASTGPFPKAVELLLENGADPNLVDDVEKFSPLMFAAAEGQLEVVKILLGNKADATLIDKDGDTAETFARQNGHVRVVEELAGHR
jgi:uncharacterized protein